MGRIRLIVFTVALLCITQCGFCQIQLGALFSDNAVLQRNAEIPIWGISKKKEKITVVFKDKKFSTRASNQGKWKITLPPLKAGGPYEIIIAGESEKIILKNILIGDVWVCSGQSNMEWKLMSSEGAKTEIESAMYGEIRHFKVPTSSALKPEALLEEGGVWTACSPKTAGDFTAVGYYFAKYLMSEGVPIGLLNSSWGGSRIETWMSARVLGFEDTQTLQKLVADKKAKLKADKISLLKTEITEIPLKENGIVGTDTVWAGMDWDDSSWESASLPGTWESKGRTTLDGIVWYRKSIELSQADIQQDAILNLGPIDDSDKTWVNGYYVGGLEDSYGDNRNYRINKSYLKVGKNTIAIRVVDTGGGGGLHGSSESMYLQCTTRKVRLAGSWKEKIDLVFLDSKYADNQIPGMVYNKMIHPLLNFPISGVIWYHGEANATNLKDALEYKILFSDLIKGWRSEWITKDFPFLYVQLPNFRKPQDKPSESLWAVLRESQSEALKIPNTAQAVIIDIGDAKSVHPLNKKEVGYRLSLAAEKLKYGKNIEFSGPVYKSMEIKENKIILNFDHIGNGLLVKDKYGYLKGFTIAGKDKKFVWAKAYVMNNKVVVYHPDIEKPVAVRYGWSDNPDDINLYNDVGLPASPFRTDQTVR